MKGVRAQVYSYADKFLGYHEDERPAIYYEIRGQSEEKDLHLKFHIIFKSEENALHFDSEVRLSASKPGSPLNSLTIQTEVRELKGAEKIGERIYFAQYDPKENEESPQATTAYSENYFSTVDEISDLFKFQRIESFGVFSSHGKAQSCHLISKAHCASYPSYANYENNENNRIALSLAMHGYFDGFSQIGNLRLFCLTYVGASESAVIEGRYKVDLLVEAFDNESAALIFPRLTDGSSATDNPLVMRTFVHVKDPAAFSKCIDWKESNTRKNWKLYV